MQAALPATCLHLLGLPQHVRHKLDAQRYQAELLQTAAQPHLTHPSSTLFAPHDSFQHCHAGMALYLRPVHGCCSLFSGQTGPEGQPLLNPCQPPNAAHLTNFDPAAGWPLNQTLPGSHHDQRPQSGFQSQARQKCALDMCVGDAVSLTVEVHSASPQAVKLEDATLTLALLQGVTVAYSPKSTTSSRTEFSHTVSSVKQRMTDSPLAAGSVRSQSGDLAAAAAAEDADVTKQWQETEELDCAPCRPAQPHEPHTEPESTPHQGASADSVTLQPGLNILTFRALPLKRGLYTLKHMQGSLGSLSLHIPVILTEANALALHSQAAAERLPNPSVAGSDAGSTRAAALGTVLSTGEVQQETVVLNVHSCRQRLAVSAAALRGTLVAGQPQWLAVAVVPLHDALQEACIHVGMASTGPTGSDAAAVSTSLASSGSRGSSASVGYGTQEEGGQPPHGPRLDILYPDRAVITALQMPSQQAITHAQTDATSASPSAAGSVTSPSPASLRRSQTALPQNVPEGSPFSASDMGDGPLRHDGGPEASVSGSSWVSLEGAQGGPNLPSWAATQPSLLWLWVRPGMRNCSALRQHNPSG